MTTDELRALILRLEDAERALWDASDPGTFHRKSAEDCCERTASSIQSTLIVLGYELSRMECAAVQREHETVLYARGPLVLFGDQQ